MRSPVRRCVGLAALAVSLLILSGTGAASAWAASGDGAAAPVAGAARISLAIPASVSTDAPGAGPGLTALASAGTTSPSCPITAASLAAEAQLLNLLNQHRAAARPPVPALRWNAALSFGARYHACDMFLHQTLSHTGSQGESPFQRMAAVGFPMPPYHQEGENIGAASGYAPPAAVSALDSAMMAEPLSYGTHHWNIVNGGYSVVGVGIIVANGQTWLTEDFAG